MRYDIARAAVEPAMEVACVIRARNPEKMSHSDLCAETRRLVEFVLEHGPAISAALASAEPERGATDAARGTEARALTKSDDAVVHILRRVLEDHRLAWYIGHATTSLEFLMIAYAEMTGRTLADVKSEIEPRIHGERPTCAQCPHCNGEAAIERETATLTERLARADAVIEAARDFWGADGSGDLICALAKYDALAVEPASAAAPAAPGDSQLIDYLTSTEWHAEMTRSGPVLVFPVDAIADQPAAADGDDDRDLRADLHAALRAAAPDTTDSAAADPDVPRVMPENNWREVWHDGCPKRGPMKRLVEFRIEDGSMLWLYECLGCGVRVYAGLDAKRTIVTRAAAPGGGEAAHHG